MFFIRIKIVHGNVIIKMDFDISMLNYLYFFKLDDFQYNVGRICKFNSLKNKNIFGY